MGVIYTGPEDVTCPPLFYYEGIVLEELLPKVYQPSSLPHTFETEFALMCWTLLYVVVDTT